MGIVNTTDYKEYAKNCIKKKLINDKQLYYRLTEAAKKNLNVIQGELTP